MRALAIALLLGIAGCNQVLGVKTFTSDDGGTTSDAPRDAPRLDSALDAAIDSTSAETVRELRMNPPANGTSVTLSNVVVVAHVASKKYGYVWIQDPGGGQYSGIQLFCNYGGTTPNCSMTQQEIDGLTVGEVVDVAGDFETILISTAPAGAVPNLEIDAPAITSTGSTMAPVAVDVPAALVSKGNYAEDGTAEPYKGTYIHVTGASTFFASSVTPGEFSSSCTDQSSPPQTGTVYIGFDMVGASQTLAIEFEFYDTVTYCLPCMGVAVPYPCTNPVSVGEGFTAVRGIVEPSYNVNGDVYLQISPTADTDIPHT